MYLQEVENVFDIKWNKNMTYGDIHRQGEIEFSYFNFDYSDPDLIKRHFDEYERESIRLRKLELIFPAYEFCLKCSHLFNLLDARGVLSVSERTNYIARVRAIAKGCAEAYFKKKYGDLDG